MGNRKSYKRKSEFTSDRGMHRSIRGIMMRWFTISSATNISLETDGNE